MLSAEDTLSTICLTANLDAISLDFIARQKIQATTLNLYIIEQLPVIHPRITTATSEP